MSAANPFDEIVRFVDQMGRQFDDASRTLETTEPFDRLPIWPEAIAVDIVEGDDELVVTADVPGFDRDEIEIRVTDRTLRLEAEHDESRKVTAEAGQYVRRERRQESMERTIHLPYDVVAEAVSASLDRGVLRITLPTASVEEGTEISIAAE